MAEKARFELRVGEIYRDVETALTEMETDLATAKKARLSNLPTDLIVRLLQPIQDRSKKVEVFWKDEAQAEAVRGKGCDFKLNKESAPLNSFWFQEFIGERLHMGEVLTPNGLWHLLYRDDGEIRRVTSNTDNKCNPNIWQKNYMQRREGEHLYATVYDRKEGLKVIQASAAKAEVFRATVVPPYLLKGVIPPAKKGDYRFILSRRDPLAKFFQDDPDVRYASAARIYYVYGKEEASVGSLRLDGEYFSIFWRGNDVFNIMRIDDRICANGLSKVFDTAWKYSEKV